MNLKEFFDLLRRSNIIRLRFFNLKLFGNLRWGIYQEFSIDDMLTLIAEFRAFIARNDNASTPSAQEPFKAGSNFAILARLCEQYYVYEGSDKLQKKVVSEVADIIAELRNDSESQAQLERLVDTQQNGIMSRFRQAHPTLKENDYILYCYLVAGFSSTTIAVLLGKEKSVVYNRVSRLKKQINEEFLP